MTMQPVGPIPVRAASLAAAYLRGQLAGRPEPYAQGVYVGDDVPSTKRPRSVVLRRDGGALDGVFDQPRLNVRVFADNTEQGEDLAGLVVALLMLWPAHDPSVTRVVHMSGPYEVPDETQSLHMALVEATIRVATL